MTKIHKVIIVISALVAALYGWLSMGEVVVQRAGGADSGVFSSCAFQMRRGRVLYRELWDHKPPMVYAVNYAAMSLGGEDMDSVRHLEYVFSAARGVLIFFLALAIFRLPWLALLTSTFMTSVFHNGRIIQGGNLTEEYASVMIVAGALFCLYAATVDGRRRPFLLAALAGSCFCTAALFKETFVLSSFPWFLYLLISRRKKWGLALLAGGAFVGGSLAVLLVVLAALASCGAVGSWFDIIAYNFVYVGKSDLSLLARFGESMSFTFRNILSGTSAFVLISFCAGLIGLFWVDYGRSYRGLIWVLGAELLLNIFGASLAGRNYGHYYMQVVPSAFLFCAFGAGFFVYGVAEIRRKGLSRVWLALKLIVPALIAIMMIAHAWHYRALIGGQPSLVFVGLAALSSSLAGLSLALQVLGRRPGRERLARVGAHLLPAVVMCFALAMDFRFWRRSIERSWCKGLPGGSDKMVAQIQKYSVPGETIWMPYGRPGIYLAARRISPTKYFFVMDHLFVDTPGSSRREKLKYISDDLQYGAPKLIILGVGRLNTGSGGVLKLAAVKKSLGILAVEGLPEFITENYCFRVQVYSYAFLERKGG
jgi:Dolichyl-phosphate-mannose-protein mannosyltransferase